jgi:hypothetical protein
MATEETFYIALIIMKFKRPEILSDNILFRNTEINKVIFLTENVKI